MFAENDITINRNWHLSCNRKKYHRRTKKTIETVYMNVVSFLPEIKSYVNPSQLHFLFIFVLAQSLKCWDCHQDDNKDCDDVTSNVEITCQNESDSCSKVVLNGSMYWIINRPFELLICLNQNLTNVMISYIEFL